MERGGTCSSSRHQAAAPHRILPSTTRFRLSEAVHLFRSFFRRSDVKYSKGGEQGPSSRKTQKVAKSRDASRPGLARRVATPFLTRKWRRRQREGDREGGKEGKRDEAGRQNGTTLKQTGQRTAAAAAAAAAALTAHSPSTIHPASNLSPSSPLFYHYRYHSDSFHFYLFYHTSPATRRKTLRATNKQRVNLPPSIPAFIPAIATT